MIYKGMVSSSELRTIHYGNKPTSESPERWIYLDMPRMQHSHVLLKDNEREFSAGDAVVIEIRKPKGEDLL